MANKFWPATALTGGADGALDAIDGAELTVGDGAMVVIAGQAHFYQVVTSAAAESSPTIIAPDANDGGLRWSRVPAFNVLDVNSAGVNCVAIRGYTNSTNAVVIGNSAAVPVAGATSAVVVGNGAQAHSTRSIAIGESANCGSTGNGNVAIGYNSYTADLRGIAIGLSSDAREDCVCLGPNSSAQNGKSISIGPNNGVTGTEAVCVGSGGNATAEMSILIGKNQQAHNTGPKIVIGTESIAAGGTYQLAIGNNLQVYGSSASAVGADGTTIPSGMNAVNVHGGVSMAPKSVEAHYSADPPYYGGLLNFSVDCSFIFGPDLDLAAGTLDTWSVTLPTGTKYYVDEIGIIVTAADTATAQPTVEFGITGDTDLFLAPTSTTSLEAAGDRNRWTNNALAGVTTLHFGVTVAATATTLKGRPYFKGVLVENQ